MPGAIEILELLQTYNVESTTGHQHYKNALWELTKARRVARNETLSAVHVREELSPKLVVLLDDFCLVDPTKVEAVEHAEAEPPALILSEEPATGLRQRKGKVSSSESQTKPAATSIMQQEDPPVVEPVSVDDDPLLMLGGSLPPRELRLAQAAAREALQSYCVAASKAAKLLTALKDKN